MMENPPSHRVRTRTRLFTYEKELKTQIRKQLERVEIGLHAVDKGHEREVTTGRIDITAMDAQGNYVVIELKVGPCPIGAMEQVLGYATDLEEETGTRCRAIIIASEFPPRIRSAACRARDLKLVPYLVEDVGFGESVAGV
jgi:RecB family endonuclease NucS